MRARRLTVALNHLHGRLYAASGGRLGGRVAGRPVLLLETTGRRSGLPRRTPVQYVEHGDELLVVAAGGGSRRPPAWLLNLQADPRAHLTIGGARVAAAARVVSGAERERLWHALCAADHRLDGAARHAGRPLPIVALAPAVQDAARDASQWGREREPLASAGPGLPA